MGVYSWITQDSNRSIIIADFRTRKYPCKTVYMWDNQGRCWEEPQYRGYGEFGGKNYHVLLAEMNNDYDEDVDDEEKRCDGIEMEGNSNILHPNFTECKEWTWRNECPYSCENQGGLVAFDDDDE